MSVPDSTGSLDALLEPSIDAATPSEPLYSLQASCMVAFFGGGFAILLFSALNSRRLGRLSRDLWLYVPGAGMVASMKVMAMHAMARGQAPPWLEVLGEGRRGWNLLLRVMAVLLCSGVAVLHRRYRKAADLQGLEPPNPWRAGLACAGVDLAVSLVLAGVVVGAR